MHGSVLFGNSVKKFGTTSGIEKWCSYVVSNHNTETDGQKLNPAYSASRNLAEHFR